MKWHITVLLLTLIIFKASPQSETCACCSESHKDFDFWIGTWEVTNPDGSPAGKNVIDKILEGCIIRENWTGERGTIGTSMNYYNQRTKQWEQLWVDNSGSQIKLKGIRKGNQMILTSESNTDSEGGRYVNKITWTLNADGTVRQLWEVLQDNGKTVVAFDGLYKKKE
tara:strand:- start:4042 stop:4545 length:504 start_codon:yes stop_codon:yes gene_type:complete